MADTEITEEEQFLYTLKEYLESERENEILKHLASAKINFIYSNTFSRKLHDQRSVYIEIKVPIASKKILESEDINWRLERYCGEIYEDNEDYGFKGVKIGILMGTPNAQSTPTSPVTYSSQNLTYENLRTKVLKANLGEIEERYLLEACVCGMAGQRLAAATMIGCAAEHLLMQLCNSYHEHLKNYGTPNEAKKFKENVLEAKKAHARLEGFQKTVQNKEKFFESLGLENSDLHFGFLDIIRQVRNESGHPTGTIIPSEDLNAIFSHYQLLVDRVHPLIKKLPNTEPLNND